MALPMMVSNVTTPLLGLVDTGVVGQLGDPAHIGGVALGSLVFTSIFFGFGFLRMATTGLTAQALGAGDRQEVLAALGRPILVALAVGCFLIAASWPIREIAFAILDGSASTEALARSYYDVRIWSSPAALVNYGLLGWFIGLGRTRIALGLQLVANLTNMVLDAVLVLHLNWGVEGVAAGSVAAEVLAAALGLLIASRRASGQPTRELLRRILAAKAFKRTFAVSGDIFVRSLALVAVIVFFMAKSAEQGDVRLAANSVLMQFVFTAAYFLDGIAFAAEALVGHAVGARDVARLRLAAYRTTLSAALVAGVLSLAFCRLRSRVHRRSDSRSRDAPGSADVPSVGCGSADGRRARVSARRHLHRCHPVRGHAERDADLSLAIFAVGWWGASTL